MPVNLGGAVLFFLLPIPVRDVHVDRDDDHGVDDLSPANRVRFASDRGRYGDDRGVEADAAAAAGDDLDEDGDSGGGPAPLEVAAIGQLLIDFSFLSFLF